MNPKISVITDEFNEPDFEKVAEWLSTNDFEYVELRNVWIKNVFNLDDIDLGEVKDILKSTGLKVSSISGGLLKTKWPGPSDEPDEQETMDDGTPIIEYQLRIADNCIKIAEALGVKYIRAFGFHKIAMFEDEMWPDWIDAMKRVVRKAEASNKVIIVENEHGCMISGMDSIMRMADEVIGEHCKLLFDPGNLLAAGERVTPEIHEKIKSFTEYIHVKDAHVIQEDPMQTKWCIIGDGDVGWKNIIELFVNDGYDSFWSVETHMGKNNAWNNTIKNLKALKSLF